MTEDRRLRDKIAKLAAEETAAGARRLSGPDLARAIVEEIDETILARRIAFRAGDGASLAVEVANRRLLGLVEAPDDLVAPGDRDRLLGPLPPDDDAALAAVAQVLDAFAAGRDSLLVTVAPLGRAVGSGMRGRSAVAVASALGFDLYAAPVALDPAEGFEAGLARLALAVLHVQDGRPGSGTGPDAGAVARLSRLDADAFARLARELDPARRDGPRHLVLSGEGEALFLGLRPDGRATAALVPAEHAGAVAALWRATGGA